MCVFTMNFASAGLVISQILMLTICTYLRNLIGL
jgi:hypothetical protein